jgi:retinitis pigmentosa 9 protein
MDEQEREINEKSAEAFLREGETLDEKELKPEDAIPDLPENQAARDFLKSAPTNGLFMPLGKEVKVMQCWRCKAYGHRYVTKLGPTLCEDVLNVMHVCRTGDRECPMRESGNKRIETIRQTIEDPMSFFVESKQQERQEKYARVEQLKVTSIGFIAHIHVVIIDNAAHVQALMVEIRAEEAARKKRKLERKAAGKQTDTSRDKKKRKKDRR